MFKNYIKVAIRNLFRYKVYSIINIVGLALGITSTILLSTICPERVDLR